MQFQRQEWMIFLCALLSVLSAAFLITEDEGPGFDVFFQTNLKELDNFPIYFDKPLPIWLRGTLIKNGLGRFEMGHRKFTHSFDAFGKLSSWKFPGNGSAFFSTKFLQSDFYKASVDKNDIASYLMFESVVPPFNEIQKLQALLRGIDNMNVNIYKFTNKQADVDEYVVLNDFWKIYQIEPTLLSTVKSVSAEIPHGQHTGSIGFLSFLSSAHPLPESGTTNHFTFVSSVSLIPGIRNKISLIRIKSMDDRELIAQWEVNKVPYMHSFSVTQNHVIFFAAPFFINVIKMLRYAEPFDCLDWYKDENTTIYVVNISTGHVESLSVGNVFTMHHVNAFETSSSEIVVDISAYSSPAFVKNLEMKTLRNFHKRNSFDVHARLKRYHINLDHKKVTVETLESNNPSSIPCAVKLDLPCINEKYRYRQYCYVYGVVLKYDNTFFSRIALVKKDLCGGTGDKLWFVHGHYPVEPWFVPFPAEKVKHEDDGYLMVPVLDGTKKQSYLAIIDARTMKTSRKAYLPTFVPFTLHGRFFDDLV